MEDAKQVTYWSLDDPEGEAWPDAGDIPAAHQVRYTVNQVPRMSFDELREEVRGGYKRLGVLRMDVDNLGEIFSSGFSNVAGPGSSKRENLATLARLSTLSFQISLYFEGWVKYICNSSPYRNLIYAVYANIWRQ